MTLPTKNKLNLILHEKVMGECIHERKGYTCIKCGDLSKARTKMDEKGRFIFVYPDYLNDPLAYWRLLQKVADKGSLNLVFTYPKDIIDCVKGCEAIADFFVPGWRE